VATKESNDAVDLRKEATLTRGPAVSATETDGVGTNANRASDWARPKRARAGRRDDHLGQQRGGRQTRARARAGGLLG
jgi:hypothetical protein